MKVKDKSFSRIMFLLTGLLLLNAGVSAQTFEAIKSQVKEHTLANGMKFIVLPRHETPVISFHTYADVGSANESYGITGISHFLEHMAFKGTKQVGTSDYARESKLLDQLDHTYDQLVLAQNEVIPDSAKINRLQTEFDKLNKEAHELVVIDEYVDMIMEEGGRGINAYTSNDATQYICSLPSNRLEFWMALESDRFMYPVFREFFEERNVVMEERRLGVETRPIGKLIEDFFAVAFKAHPYKHEVIGHMSDLMRITRDDVQDYFTKYYGPSNLTSAIVGDVDADALFEMADIYFGRIPSAPKPDPLRTIEPEQWGQRHVTVEAQSQPMVLIGYHRPNINDPDDLNFDAMANIFGQGRSSRIYKNLVKEKKVAIQVGSFNGWPGNKFPNMFAVYAFPAQGHTVEECMAAIDAEIEIIKKEMVTEEELTKYKRHTKKWLIDRMKSNSQMAAALTFNEVIRGDWRKTFDSIKEVEKITAEGIQAVAQRYLNVKNRTIGEIIPEAQ